MRLLSEVWVSDQNFPSEAIVSFDEAVKSYKTGAYRAALLFSYVGWGLVIRRRILTAKCPKNMPVEKWNGIQKQLLDDDRWDDKTFECTQMKDSPVPIFLVPDSIREEVKYWKNRRNDCAHFKLNEISSAHVEAFWAFIRSNLPKFVPNGSIEDLIDRISRHFDPNYTPPGSSVQPIINMLPAAVLPTELPRFFNEVGSILSESVNGTTVTKTSELADVIDVTRLLEGFTREFGDLDIGRAIPAISPFFKRRRGAKPATATGQSRLCRTLTA